MLTILQELWQQDSASLYRLSCKGLPPFFHLAASGSPNAAAPQGGILMVRFHAKQDFPDLSASIDLQTGMVMKIWL